MLSIHLGCTASWLSSRLSMISRRVECIVIFEFTILSMVHQVNFLSSWDDNVFVYPDLLSSIAGGVYDP